MSLSEAMDIDNNDSPSSDPSHLRAAALLTRRSKRRKPTADPHLLPRPIPDESSSIQLDYGQEDTPSTSTDPIPASSTATDIPPRLDSSLEDDRVREEGEISETEGTPLKPPIPLQESLEDAPMLSVSPKSSMSELTVHPRVEPISENMPPSAFPKVFPTSAIIIDADHVRPGLAMNQDQYNAVKDIVLDLLGWGVPPEYLVDCNLSREIVFYVFSELNLRLPLNLDTSGLIPYSPDLLASTPAHLVPLRSTSMPPPPSRPQIVTGSSIRPPQSQFGLPSKPTIDNVSATAASPSNTSNSATRSSDTPTPVDSGTVTSSASTSLHDMEQQRRKELLARKAVQASRKQKPLSSSIASSSSGGKDRDVDASSSVHVDQVEDFLKSIGPVLDETDTSINDQMEVEGAQGKSRVVASPDPMETDVDETIPGLSSSGLQADENTRSTTTTSLSGSTPNSVREIDSMPPPSSAQSSDYPPSSTDSTKTVFDQGGSETNQSFSSVESVTSSQRRGTKRPVAADFVDFESGRSGSVGYVNGSRSMNHIQRRKIALGGGSGNGSGMFASVSGMRRCVIDLSDSEGEGGEEEMREANNMYRERESRELSAGAADIVRVFGSGIRTPGHGWATPPQSVNGILSNPVPSGGNTGSMTPIALMEKEQEIKKMRELIAHREQLRHKKLVASKSTIGTPEITSASETTIKQEEDEVAASLNGASQHHTNGHSITMPLNIEEEDMNMDLEDSNPHVNLISRLSSPSASASATPPIDFGASRTSTTTRTLERSGGHQGLEVVGEDKQAVDHIVGETELQSRQHSLHQERQGRPADDDSEPSSSAQMVASQTQDEPVHQQQDAKETGEDYGYSTYDSVFEWYPLLRGGSSSSSSSSLVSSRPSPSSHSFIFPSLKPLRLATAIKTLDPLKRICQYEVPGGGVCRDGGCEDVHLSSVEPSDEETAAYLYEVLPSEYKISVGKIKDALGQERASATAGLEARVARAVALLT